jgi:hypothetical protein
MRTIKLSLLLILTLSLLAGSSPSRAASGGPIYLPYLASPPPTFGVDASLDQHAISPLIYGMNFASESLAKELHLGIRREGGNSTTRYNYLTDTHNTGSDWYFENIVDYDASRGALPGGSSANAFIEENQRAGAQSLITLPLIGWVPKTYSGGPGHDCGFKKAKYPNQQSFDYWDATCGNGVNSNGTQISGNAATDTSQVADAAFIGDWVTYLKERYGSAASGGVGFYNLDNEPMLWPSTHRDVHPGKTNYAEMRTRTYQYAAAVKAADPSAKTLGPVVWGWCAYFYSAADGCGPGADYANHANTPFIPWYLQQMKAYEQANGVRILDYLDVHIYPQASGVFSDDAGTAATQALRLRSTRALWDPAYTDESWIGDKVQLIPRMKEWVAANYPGTKLAISEYSWGAMGSLNGALAQAEILGIFGREGLDLATLWAPPAANQPGAYAFRIYRNYDGAGGAFGETSVHSYTPNASNISVFAALRAADGALTVMVINKSGSAVNTPLSIAGASGTTARVYRYSAENLNAILRKADVTLSSGSVSITFPANSITLLVIK